MPHAFNDHPEHSAIDYLICLMALSTATRLSDRQAKTLPEKRTALQVGTQARCGMHQRASKAQGGWGSKRGRPAGFVALCFMCGLLRHERSVARRLSVHFVELSGQPPPTLGEVKKCEFAFRLRRCAGCLEALVCSRAEFVASHCRPG
jgi:hypothetical protein